MPAGAFRNKPFMPNFTGPVKTGAVLAGRSGLRGAPAGIGGLGAVRPVAVAGVESNPTPWLGWVAILGIAGLVFLGTLAIKPKRRA